MLQDLAIVLGVAGVTAVVFQRLQLPLVFGFLVAGVIIGPNTPPFQLVQDEASLSTLANLGVVFLLFGLGLEFNLRRLRRVGGIALMVVVTEVLLTFWLGFELGRLIGWDKLDSVFLGAMISISSTAIVVKVLRDLGRLQEEASQIVFGVLVLEDIIAILMLVLLSGYAATGNLGLRELGLVSSRMALFLLGSVLLGILLVPRLVDYVIRRHGNEILIIVLVALALGYAALSDLSNFHVGLGAFIMGALVAESAHHEDVVRQFRPVHDIFAAIFFVTIGTLVDFDLLVTFWKPVLAISGIVVVAKLLGGAIPTLLGGYRGTVAVAVGASLAQMGEFSFVIAQLGRETGVTSDFLFPIIVGAAVLSSFTAPLMIRFSGAIARFLGRMAPAPVRVYIGLYSRWMTTVRSRNGTGRRPQRERARRRLWASATVLLTALGAAWLFQARGRAALATQGFEDPLQTLTYWGIVLALVVPILFRVFHTMNAWIATWALPSTGTRAGLQARNVVRTTFYLLGSVLLGLPVLAATAPFLRSPVIVLGWLALVATAVIVLWASITRLHARIEDTVQSLLDDSQVPMSAPQVLQDIVASDVPWELSVDTFELQPNTWAAGKRLAEIELRSSTGATLIFIERGEDREEAPGPNTLLLPGDRLTLIGTPEHLAAARAAFARPAPTGARKSLMRLGRLYVVDGSELEGVKLADAALPKRTGIQVVAIVRNAGTITNPGANERLKAGDVVLVLGTQESIAAATAFVSPKKSGGSDAGPPPAPA